MPEAKISGPQRKFCEEIVRGEPYGAAYRTAYPKASEAAAATAGPRLFKNVQIQEEIARLRAKSDEKAGSAVLTRAEKRMFFARLVRARVAKEPANSDLWNSIKTTEQGVEYRLPDKLAAIKLDNDLAGEGSEAEGQDALGKLLERVMK